MVDPMHASRAKLVYIAGPYRDPDPVENTRRAIDAWKTLRCAGYAPVCPHLSMLLHLVYPADPEFWLEYDLDILAACDILLRLPGVSPGADGEVAFAREHAITCHFGTAAEFVRLYPEGDHETG